MPGISPLTSASPGDRDASRLLDSAPASAAAISRERVLSGIGPRPMPLADNRTQGADPRALDWSPGIGSAGVNSARVAPQPNQNREFPTGALAADYGPGENELGSRHGTRDLEPSQPVEQH